MFQSSFLIPGNVECGFTWFQQLNHSNAQCLTISVSWPVYHSFSVYVLLDTKIYFHSEDWRHSLNETTFYQLHLSSYLGPWYQVSIALWGRDLWGPRSRTTWAHNTSEPTVALHSVQCGLDFGTEMVIAALIIASLNEEIGRPSSRNIRTNGWLTKKLLCTLIRYDLRYL